jgi:hypothetical protein
MEKSCHTLEVTEDAFVWVAVGETTNSMGRFITNLVAGKSDIEIPSNPLLICSKALHHTIPLKLLILYSDAVAYMLKAASVLKVFHPNLIHYLPGSRTASCCRGG